MSTWLIVLISIVCLFVVVMLWRMRNLHTQVSHEMSQMRLSAHQMWEGVGRRETENLKDRESTPMDREDYIDGKVAHYIALREYGETHSGAIKRVNVAAEPK